MYIDTQAATFSQQPDTKLGSRQVVNTHPVVLQMQPLRVWLQLSPAGRHQKTGVGPSQHPHDVPAAMQGGVLVDVTMVGIISRCFMPEC